MKSKKNKIYKKLFRKISKKIGGIFSKKKITRHHKKENKYISFFRKIFKGHKKLKNPKIFIGSILLFFITITIISFSINFSNKQNNNKADINYDFMHGAAGSGREFLFEGESGHDSNLIVDETNYNSGQGLYVGSMETSNTGQIQTGTRELNGSNSNSGINLSGKNISGTILNSGTEIEIKDPNVIILPIDVSKYLIRKLKEQIKLQKALSETVKKDCMSPRNTFVKNGDFVLAYKQRTDVNNICDTEKRYCNDGILEGSFTQEKCDNKAKYEYQTADIKSYTQKPRDIFVQPSKPINNSTQFSTDGKINTNNVSNTNRGYSQSGPQTINEKETGLKYISNSSDCKSPRGNTVKNGQFVTAYKAPVGFIDMECKSEYRYCTNGKLGGSYSYKECKYKDITYNDYLVGNTDTDKATSLDLVDSIDPQDKTDSESIRSKIQSLFR